MICYCLVGLKQKITKHMQFVVWDRNLTFCCCFYFRRLGKLGTGPASSHQILVMWKLGHPRFDWNPWGTIEWREQPRTFKHIQSFIRETFSNEFVDMHITSQYYECPCFSNDFQSLSLSLSLYIYIYIIYWTVGFFNFQVSLKVSGNFGAQLGQHCQNQWEIANLQCCSISWATIRTIY